MITLPVHFSSCDGNVTLLFVSTVITQAVDSAFSTCEIILRLSEAQNRLRMRLSRTAMATNEWVLNKAGVKRKLLETVKTRKLAYYGHTTRKQGSCLEKEIIQETMPGARRRGRPRTAWMDNIKTWTGLPWKSQSE